MVTVHKMPLKNQFLTGMICGFDKTPNQNETKPFTTLRFAINFMYGVYSKESCHGIAPILIRTEILYHTSTKRSAELMPGAWDFKSIKSNLEI